MIVANLIFSNLKEVVMTTKIKSQDNTANQQNTNKGTSGTNRQYSQVNGNRSKQIQQTQSKKGA